MDFRSSVDTTCCHAMEEADPQCASSMPDALCTAVERASVSQSYAGFCAVEQACEFQSYVGFNDGAATNNLDLSGTVDHANNITRCLILEQEVLCGRKCPAVPHNLQRKWRLRPNWPRTPQARPLNHRHAIHSRERSRSSRRHEGKEEPVGLTSVHLSHQFGFRDATLWCWRCGGWSAGSRRASRSKDPCGVLTKTGADVVYRVSERYPPKAHLWRSDDVFWCP